MAEWANIDDIETYEDAVQVVLEGIGMRVDPRKVLWCNYPVFWHERNELEEKVDKDKRKLEKEVDDDLYSSKLWYVGVPRFKLIGRGIAHLTCEIDLYYVACDTTGNYHQCWYGKIIPKADRFECPLSLVEPLVNSLKKNEIEFENAKVVERSPGYTVYDYLGREWKIPDAFLGFAWALREKGKGFEGLLDPVSCALTDKFSKEHPSRETPMLTTGTQVGSYEDLVNGLRSLGWNKIQAEERAKYVMEKYPNASLEKKIGYALSD
jgi:hypothetical protein